MKKIAYILLILICSIAQTNGQLWPGDVNNNGITNNVDLLFLGQAFGETGPPRDIPEQGIFWEAKELGTPWTNDFPNGVNHAYADCNGDGFVFWDDIFAIEDNYNETHGSVTNDVFIAGNPTSNPSLFFTSFGEPLIEGTPLALNIVLGTPGLPVDDFYGIAFTIHYDPSVYLTDFGGIISFHENSWLGDPSNLVETVHMDPDAGILEAAIVRIDGTPINQGFGEIASFFIIIEDNVVGWAEPDLETTIYFDNVQLIDDSFETNPVFPDSLPIVILNDNVIAATNEIPNEAINLYPNPAQDELFIDVPDYDLNIQRIEIFNAVGLQMDSARSYNLQQSPIQIPTKNFPSGIYLIKIHSDKGILHKKVLIAG